MTSISSVPSNYANAVTPYVPLGRQPVGQESSELKASSFKALEQPAASGRNENRRSAEDKVADQQIETDLSHQDASAKAQEEQKQLQLQERAKAQRAEDAKNAEKQQSLRKEAREVADKGEERAARSRAEAIERFKQLNHKTFNLNRHLVEIGAVEGTAAKGTILDQEI